MELQMVFLFFSAFGAVVADEESCAGRCGLGFQPDVKCQCDAVCAFYTSCCRDYHTVCVKTRGDVFAIPEEDVYDFDTHDSDFLANVTDEMYPDINSRLEPDLELEPTRASERTHPPEPTHELESTHEPEPTHPPEPTHEPVTSPEPVPTHDPVPGNMCLSEKPFDAFTDLKNGSIFAFQGQYFYELDKIGVAAGYPKLILDVWGVLGPIDAAFTRINCEGKTYLFKGMMYWRFNDGIMEDGFPKPIKDGFPGIPTHLDAALAIPASSIHGKEQVYFFKGNRYWQYVFEHQPTQAECAGIPISISFQRYTYVMADNWDGFFSELFGPISSACTSGSFSIREHWHGIPSQVDSAMIGKLFMVRKRKGRSRRRGKHPRRRRPWMHQSSEEDAFTLVPSQSVYFFVRDKYYRVDLDSKRVASAWPRYPRSITKYWFKCEVE